MPSLIINSHDNPTTSVATLIHWYSFDGTLNDQVGTAHLSVNGTGSDWGYQAAAINGLGQSAINTNTGDSQNCGFNTDTLFFPAGNDFSIAAWIYIVDTADTYEHTLIHQTTSTPNKGVMVSFYPNHKVNVNLFNTTVVEYSLSHTVPYQTWTHVAVTFNYAGKEMKFYKNGLYVTNATNVSNDWADPVDNISEIMSGNNYYGRRQAGIDDARYYTGLLTDEEIFRIYRYLA